MSSIGGQCSPNVSPVGLLIAPTPLLLPLSSSRRASNTESSTTATPPSNLCVSGEYGRKYAEYSIVRTMATSASTCIQDGGFGVSCACPCVWVCVSVCVVCIVCVLAKGKMHPYTFTFTRTNKYAKVRALSARSHHLTLSLLSGKPELSMCTTRASSFSPAPAAPGWATPGDGLATALSVRPFCTAFCRREEVWWFLQCWMRDSRSSEAAYEAAEKTICMPASKLAAASPPVFWRLPEGLPRGHASLHWTGPARAVSA